MKGPHLFNMKISKLDIDRIKAKTIINRQSECWIYSGATARGYGRVWINGKLGIAHRIAYEFFVGPIPDGLQIDHVRARGCISRACWNPRHLELVTNHENILRGNRNQNRGKTHCKSGHTFEGNNLIVTRDGRRQCRECHRRWQRKCNQTRRPADAQNGASRWKAGNLATRTRRDDVKSRSCVIASCEKSASMKRIAGHSAVGKLSVDMPSLSSAAFPTVLVGRI